MSVILTTTESIKNELNKLHRLPTGTTEIATFVTKIKESTTNLLETESLPIPTVTSTRSMTSYIESSSVSNENGISSSMSKSDGLSTVVGIDAATDILEIKTVKKYADVLVSNGNWSSVVNTSVCKTLLEPPVTKIYVRETQTKNCHNYFRCKGLVLDIQRHEILYYGDDIQSNFVITGDGLIFEGLSWRCKVHHWRTENSAIWISLTGNSKDWEGYKNYINHKQYSSLKLFLTEHLVSGKLALSYHLIPFCCIISGSNPGEAVFNNLTQFETFYGEECLKTHQCRPKY